MYMMYVDECGDPGSFMGMNSEHFILSGLIVSIDDWNMAFSRMKELRRSFKDRYGLSVKTELHAAELIRIDGIEAYRSIPKHRRIQILREFVGEMPTIFSSGRLINVCIDKTRVPTGAFKNYNDMAWHRLLQRYDTWLKKSGKGYGIVIGDATEEKLIRTLLRKMRVYNPTPSRFGGYYQALTDRIVEDPFLRDSQHSYFIQAVDAVAHCLYRREYPKGALRKHGVHAIFNALEPMLVKGAAADDPYGIVRK